MSFRLIKSASWWPIIVACATTLLCASCATDKSSPTAPTSAPAQTPPPPPTPATLTAANVQLTVNPNPVLFSGQPITDTASCTGSKNTWFYDQVFKETAGVSVIFTSRIDKFDNTPVGNQTGLNVSVPASGSLTWHSRWCSATPTAHTAQTIWTGMDANGHSITATGPVVQLMAQGAK
jgi:hypothetical protein